MTNLNNSLNTSVLNTIEQSIQPLLKNVATFKRFKGFYTLTARSQRIDKYGKPYWIIKLSDISTTINVYCFNMNDFIEQLTINTLVQIEASLKQIDGYQYIRCAFLQKVDNAWVNNKLSIEALPSYYCNASSLLQKLKQLVDSINSLALKQFLAKVLVNNEVGRYYLQCPASLQHHHNYAGGLLAHSIDVANKMLANNNFNQKEHDIAIVAALLHDIGKTKTLAINGTRTALGLSVDHDELTLEICAPALAELDNVEPHTAILLRHIWTCASPNARYGYQAITPIATALQQADKQSAELNIGMHINPKIA